VLEALPTLIEEFPDLAYVVAGEGVDRKRLEAKAEALGISRHVVFTGYVPEEDKPDLYRLADAFVLAGRGEGFGIVLLEAMASGVPVLGSTLDATREVLKDGALGAVVDPRDGEALRTAIASLLRRPKGIVPDELSRYAYPEFVVRTHATIARIVAMAPAIANKSPREKAR
jgi:glycosyltransferase involved in cell wall biosynthesis